jgi:DNA-binding transcriptional ArsR family regulator
VQTVIWLRGGMGSVVRITLDAETFKALASPTRLTVLRALDERRKTLTEISRDLSLNKATVHEHLALLAAADLVRKRDDEGRKWIYYELTWRGQKLLHPQETTTFNVLLGLGVAAAGGGIGLLAHSLQVALQPHAETAFFPTVENAPEPDNALRASTAPTDTSTASAGTTTAAPASAGTATASPSYTSSPSATGTTPPSAAGGAGAGTHAPDTGATAYDAVQAHPAPATPSHGAFLDDSGAFGLALLAFAALMALLAWLLRRHLRADPFRPPAAPEEP